MNRLPGPINGRIVGFAIAVIAAAISIRVAWTVVQPIVPSMVSLLALVIIYRVMFRGGGH